MEEGITLITKVRNQNLPNNDDGYPDICQAPEELKQECLAFIKKVNEAGGSLPEYDCK